MRHAHSVSILASSTLLFATALLAGPSSAPAPGSQSPLASDQPPGLVSKPDWVDDVIDIINDIINAGGGAEDSIAQHYPNPPQAVLNALEVDLQIMEDRINQILDPLPYPNLEPVDAGQPGTTVAFDTLADCAEQCTIWAELALDECNQRAPSHIVIGNRLDSIRLALTQYREMAGLPQN